MKIEMQGEKEVKAFMKSFGDYGIKVMQDELYSIAQHVRKDAIKSMRTSPAGGKIYKRKGKVHISSLPGFPPRPDTGNLMNRIFARKRFDYSEVYTDGVKYAKWLEKGTRRILPRPFIEPAVERSNWRRRLLNRITAERFAGRRINE